MDRVEARGKTEMSDRPGSPSGCLAFSPHWAKGPTHSTGSCTCVRCCSVVMAAGISRHLAGQKESQLVVMSEVCPLAHAPAALLLGTRSAAMPDTRPQDSRQARHVSFPPAAERSDAPVPRCCYAHTQTHVSTRVLRAARGWARSASRLCVCAHVHMQG